MSNASCAFRLPPLPLDSLKDALCRSLTSDPSFLLEAPPGTGKSTRVPLWALECLPGKVLLLEPRRIAARMLAGHLARLTGTRPGELVGLVMRRERCLGRDTRLLVLTEGVFTRMIAEDPELAGTSCVLFDEFHERHLTSDTGLALALQSQRILRPDLHLGILSATLDTEALTALLPEAPVHVSQTPGHPVDIVHAPLPGSRTMAERLRALPGHMAHIILGLLAREEGSLLAFLPGAGEIGRTRQELEGRLPANCDLHVLYGRLGADAQQAALAPAPAGRRKVVLATDIAETSLTIEGIRLVVDSGLQRRPHYEPGSAALRLVTRPIPLSSATQRCGRAGRLCSGLAVRLWSRESEQGLPAHARPEILETDLADLALNLALWGEAPQDLSFVTQPPRGAFEEARKVLARLGAIDRQGKITPLGRDMARLGFAPRTARILLAAGTAEETALAAVLCAFLEEEARTQLRAGTDVRAVLESLLRPNSPLPRALRDNVLDTARLMLARLARVRRDMGPAAGGTGNAAGPRTGTAARRPVGAFTKEGLATLALGLLAGEPAGMGDGAGSLAGRLLLPGFADRLILRKDANTGLLRSGTAITLPAADFRLALALDATLPDPARLREAGTQAASCASLALFCPAGEDDVLRLLQGDMDRRRLVEVQAQGTVQARETLCLDALVLASERVRATEEERLDALCRHVLARNLRDLPWTDECTTFLARVRLVAGTMQQAGGEPWPGLDRDRLVRDWQDWLPAALQDCQGLGDLAPATLLTALRGLVPWEILSRLDRLAETAWTSPCGRKHAIDYTGEQPCIRLKLQECFGCRTSPVLGCGQPLTLHLLSPGGAVLAVTKDLAFFWQEVYPSVRAEMRGRYPRHPWPEDPLSAMPTTLTQKALQARSRKEEARGRS